MVLFLTVVCLGLGKIPTARGYSDSSSGERCAWAGALAVYGAFRIIERIYLSYNETEQASKNLASSCSIVV